MMACWPYEWNNVPMYGCNVSLCCIAVFFALNGYREISGTAIVTFLSVVDDLNKVCVDSRDLKVLLIMLLYSSSFLLLACVYTAGATLYALSYRCVNHHCVVASKKHTIYTYSMNIP